ncbi:MAG: hypothetical protein ACK5M3_17990 [Dysgonomonas sp.]
MLSFLVGKNSGNVSENWNSVFQKRIEPNEIGSEKGKMENIFGVIYLPDF